MNAKLKVLRNFHLLAFAMVMLLAGCSGSDGGLTMLDIPKYPGAMEEASIEQSMMGFMSGSLRQYSTPDSFDEVVSFYENALSQYPYEVMSNRSELGRQTAISIPRGDGVLTVAIQEFIEENSVSITFMEVGS
jgi:hypothetical protein